MSFRSDRTDYGKHTLLEEDCPEQPKELLQFWLDQAREVTPDANAMTLSTVSDEGKPSSRVVLIRDITDEGISFFTNYHSRKGEDMARNHHVALNFFWPQHERQVRIEGVVQQLPAEESDAYFNSRPRESQIGAWASSQSRELASQRDLERLVTEVTQKYDGLVVPRPPHWGGYRVSPELFEFWQGRPSRLHDRIAYTLEGEADWKMKRLFP